MPDYKKVSELKLDVIFPEAEQVEKEDILQKEIIIEDFEVLRGKYGDFAVVCFFYADNESKKFTFVGGSVITAKLKRIRAGVAKGEAGLPVLGIITKPEGKRYFDLE